MTTTKTPTGEYLADRYDRLRKCAGILAADPAMVANDSIYGAEGLRAFTQSVIDARLLDGLSEHDADTVAMLMILDFTKGPERMAWRLSDWLRPVKADPAAGTEPVSRSIRSVNRHDDNDAAVICVLALAFGLVMSAFAGPEFEEASRVAKMFDTPDGTAAADR